MTTEAPIDDIEAFVSSYDSTSEYKTVRLLKENTGERTELVCDESGASFIRKYLRVEPGVSHPYELVASVGCPLLPDVVSCVRTGDTLVVVCSWVAGDTVEALQASGELTEELSFRIFDDVCTAASALHHAPAAPIVHRDINPSNIVYDGHHAHLLDLGIARSYKEGARADTQLWGTAGYAAPEQFGFGQSDGRCDVFALGMLLRFLLTGRHPDEEGGQVGRALSRVIAKATSIDPKARYKDVESLARAAAKARRQDALEGKGLLPAPLRRVVWPVWCVCAWVCALFVSGVFACDIVTGGCGTVGQGLFEFVMLVCWALVPAILFADAFGLTRRIGYFATDRRRHLLTAFAVDLVGSILVLMVIVLAFAPLHS